MDGRTDGNTSFLCLPGNAAGDNKELLCHCENHMTAIGEIVNILYISEIKMQDRNKYKDLCDILSTRKYA